MIAALSGIVILLSCGGGGDSTTAPSTNPPVTPPPSQPNTIMTAGNAFAPPTITIVAGTSVTFTLPFNHNAEFESSAISDLGFGVSAARTFAAPGTYRFRCEAHSSSYSDGMSGTVVVQ